MIPPYSSQYKAKTVATILATSNPIKIISSPVQCAENPLTKCLFDRFDRSKWLKVQAFLCPKMSFNDQKQNAF